MPTTKVELNHRDEPLNRIVDLRDGQEHLWMAHEATAV